MKYNTTKENATCLCSKVASALLQQFMLLHNKFSVSLQKSFRVNVHLCFISFSQTSDKNIFNVAFLLIIAKRISVWYVCRISIRGYRYGYFIFSFITRLFVVWKMNALKGQNICFDLDAVYLNRPFQFKYWY